MKSLFHWEKLICFQIKREKPFMVEVPGKKRQKNQWIGSDEDLGFDED
jgi:hypothetical protein